MADKRMQTYYLQNEVIYKLLDPYYRDSSSILHLHDYFNPLIKINKALGIIRNHSYSSHIGPALDAKIRILHALPDIKKIDVEANKKTIVSDFAFQKVSEYFWLPAGNCQIDIFESANKTKKNLNKEIQLEAGKSYTLAITGKRNKIRLFFMENQSNVPIGETKIRFLHLSIETPSLDVAVKARDVVFSDVSYPHVTEYLGLTPMTVDLELRTAGSKQVVLPMPKLKFIANHAYTLIFLGPKMNLQIIKD